MTTRPDSWKRIGSKQIADCRVFRVREDTCRRESDRKESTFFVLESPDWVNIIAVTQAKDVVLIEQFRHGTEETILELPGGLIDEDENPETAARRELLEETGYSSDKWVRIGITNPNPAIQNNSMHHFFALDCEKVSDTKFDEHESIVEKLVPLTDIDDLILGGNITHSLVVAAFYFLERNNKI